MLKEIPFFLFIVLCFSKLPWGCFYPLSVSVVFSDPHNNCLTTPNILRGTREVSSGSMFLLLQEEQLTIA